MGAEMFMLFVAMHWDSYLLWLVLSIAVLIPITRRCSLGWFDPMRYVAIFAMLANAVPPFLYQYSLCSAEMLTYFFLSEGLFWLGISTWAKARAKLSPVGLAYEHEVGYNIYVFAMVFYFAITFLSYALYGIPLFLDKSRLSVYSGSGGFGLFIRINGLFAIYILVYGFYLLHKGKQHFMSLLGLLGVTLVLLLNGSKSGLLNVMYAYWGFSVYYLYKVPQSKRVFLYLLGGGLMAVGIILIQTLKDEGNFLTALIGLLTRLTGSGDAFYIAMPYNNYDVVEIQDPMRYLFSGPLAAFRVISADELVSIGNQLGWYIYPNSLGENLGPNARMPILSFILYGWGGLLLSYLSGLLVSFVQYRTARYFSSGIIGVAFFTYVYICFSSAVTDLGLGLGFLFDFFINGVVLLVLIYMFTYYQSVRHRNLPQHLMSSHSQPSPKLCA